MTLLKQAERRVVRAAMRWWHHNKLMYPGVKCRCSSCQLSRACAALTAQRKRKGRG